jgi:putative oxidoreductase
MTNASGPAKKIQKICSMIIEHYKYEIFSLLVRVFTGLLFLFQGYDKVFNIGIKNCIQTFRNDYEKINLPYGLLRFVVVFTSYSELIGGGLLILGLFYTYSLIFLGLDLIIVAIAFGMVQPMWDTRHAFPRFLLIILNMFVLTHFYKLTLDHFFNLH